MTPRKLVHTYIGYLKLDIFQKTGIWTWFNKEKILFSLAQHFITD